MLEFEWWRLYKRSNNFKKTSEKTFPTDVHLQLTKYYKELKNGKLFGYVQCDVEVPIKLRVNFAKFPPIFKNIFVGKKDISDY